MRAVAMFYGSESRDSADVRRCFCRYAPPRQYPSLAHGGLSLLEVAVPFIELSKPNN